MVAVFLLPKLNFELVEDSIGSKNPKAEVIPANRIAKNNNGARILPIGYAILKLFMQNPGRALSREDIMAAVWGRDYEGELKIVDVNIRRLRIKIEDDPTMPSFITTVWGYGYKWGF